MSATRSLFAILMLALMLIIAACSRSEDAIIQPQGHETVRGPVAWTLPADQCPSLPAGLTVNGTGEHKSVTNTKVKADGSTQIITNDVAKGTAVGSDGSTYHFIYQNHSTQTIPPSGTSTQIEMKDSFILNGNGGATTLSVGFLWRWTFPSGSDPFAVWPPDNFQPVSTRGEPLLCDPL